MSSCVSIPGYRRLRREGNFADQRNAQRDAAITAVDLLQVSQVPDFLNRLRNSEVKDAMGDYFLELENEKRRIKRNRTQEENRITEQKQEMSQQRAAAERQSLSRTMRTQRFQNRAPDELTAFSRVINTLHENKLLITAKKSKLPVHVGILAFLWQWNTRTPGVEKIAWQDAVQWFRDSVEYLKNAEEFPLQWWGAIVGARDLFITLDADPDDVETYDYAKNFEGVGGYWGLGNVGMSSESFDTLIEYLKTIIDDEDPYEFLGLEQVDQ